MTDKMADTEDELGLLFESIGLAEDAKLSLLDYRTFRPTGDDGVLYRFFREIAAGNPDVLQNLSEQEENRSYNSRDVLYAILTHCDEFLLQELVKCMFNLGYAVPILMTPNGEKNVLLNLWGIRKCTYTASINENPPQNLRLATTALYTVSFLSYNDSKGSKTYLLNGLLKYLKVPHWHGNPSFLSDGGNAFNGKLSDGVVEGTWHFPTSDNDNHVEFPFFVMNLNGNVHEHPKQANFCTKVSSLVIVSVGHQIDEVCQKLFKEANPSCKFVVVVGPAFSQDANNFSNGNVTFIKRGETKSLESISKLVEIINEQYGHSAPISLESCAEVCSALDIPVDENQGLIPLAKKGAVKFFESFSRIAIEERKQVFKLHEKLREWIKIKIGADKGQMRTSQNSLSLSKIILAFLQLAKDVERYNFIFTYLEMYFDDSTYTTIVELLHSYTSALEKKRASFKQSDKTDVSLKECLDHIDEQNVNIDHFIREFGQIVECHYQLKGHNIPSLTQNCAMSLLQGSPLEIMYSDTGYIPKIWLTKIFQKLSEDKRFVRVVSILGPPRSGKSTLLSRLFGISSCSNVCTRGIRMYAVPVHPDISKQTPCDYLLILDTESISPYEETEISGLSKNDYITTFICNISDVVLINVDESCPKIEVDKVFSHVFSGLTHSDKTPVTCILKHVSGSSTNDAVQPDLESLIGEEWGSKLKCFVDIAVRLVRLIAISQSSEITESYYFEIGRLRNILYELLGQNPESPRTFMELTQRITRIELKLKQTKYHKLFQQTKDTISTEISVLKAMQNNVKPKQEPKRLRDEVISKQIKGLGSSKTGSFNKMVKVSATHQKSKQTAVDITRTPDIETHNVTPEMKITVKSGANERMVTKGPHQYSESLRQASANVSKQEDTSQKQNKNSEREGAETNRSGLIFVKVTATKQPSDKTKDTADGGQYSPQIADDKQESEPPRDESPEENVINGDQRIFYVDKKDSDVEGVLDLQMGSIPGRVLKSKDSSTPDRSDVDVQDGKVGHGLDGSEKIKNVKKERSVEETSGTTDIRDQREVHLGQLNMEGKNGTVAETGMYQLHKSRDDGYSNRKVSEEKVIPIKICKEEFAPSEMKVLKVEFVSGNTEERQGDGDNHLSQNDVKQACSEQSTNRHVVVHELVTKDEKSVDPNIADQQGIQEIITLIGELKANVENCYSVEEIKDRVEQGLPALLEGVVEKYPDPNLDSIRSSMELKFKETFKKSYADVLTLTEIQSMKTFASTSNHVKSLEDMNSLQERFNIKNLGLENSFSKLIPQIDALSADIDNFETNTKTALKLFREFEEQGHCSLGLDTVTIWALLCSKFVCSVHWRHVQAELQVIMFNQYDENGHFTMSENEFEKLKLDLQHLDYKIQYAEPLLYNTLQGKLAVILSNIEQTCTDLDFVPLKQCLTPISCSNYDNVPMETLHIQQLDRGLITLLPPLKSETMLIVTSAVNEAKCNVIAATLSRHSLDVEHLLSELSEIINGLIHENEGKHKIRAAALAHVSAWALNLTAVQEQERLRKVSCVASLKKNTATITIGLCKYRGVECDTLVAETFFKAVAEIMQSYVEKEFLENLIKAITQREDIISKRLIVGNILKLLLKEGNFRAFINFVGKNDALRKNWLLHYLGRKINVKSMSVIKLTLTEVVRKAISIIRNIITGTTTSASKGECQTLNSWLEMFKKALKDNIEVNNEMDDLRVLQMTAQVNSMSNFTETCSSLMKELEESLIGSMALPEEDNGQETTKWIRSLPLRVIDELLIILTGCPEQCPYCGAPCMSFECSDGTHYTDTHIPLGIKGTIQTGSSGILSFQSCKELELEIPWNEPEDNKDATVYWRHIFSRYYHKFAEYYQCPTSGMPQGWLKYSKEDALASLKTAYG